MVEVLENSYKNDLLKINLITHDQQVNQIIENYFYA